MRQILLALWRLLDANYHVLLVAGSKNMKEVVIIGSYCGEMAEQYAKRGLRVCGYEPVRHYARAAQQRCRGLPVKIYPYGLGGKKCTTTFHLDGDSSQISKQAPYRAKIQDAAVALRQKKGLLYLNCEGSEYSILEHLSQRNMLRQFTRILIQFHPTKNKQERNKIVKKLRRTHFRTYNVPYVWECWEKRG